MCLAMAFEIVGGGGGGVNDLCTCVSMHML